MKRKKIVERKEKNYKKKQTKNVFFFLKINERKKKINVIGKEIVNKMEKRKK